MNIYVNASAELNGDGSSEKPFRSINEAAKNAKAGDTVLVAPGVYREYVDPVSGGTEEQRITYKSIEPLGAVITGAERIDSWLPYQGNVWICTVNNRFFGDYNPYTTLVEGDWYFAPPVRHTGAVYLNDRQMYETISLEECMEGKAYPASWEPEQSVYKWYTEQKDGSTVIYANFHGKDPNRENVEINVRRNCFFPSRTGVNYITVSGFMISKAATTWAPPAAFQDGMIGPHWSKGWVIEDCDINNSKCVGISLGKYLDPENEQYAFHKRVKSPTQMERDAVCRGLYHGWSKDTVGSHVIRRCNIHHCEQAGIAGRMGAVFSLIEDNHIHHINNMQQLGGAEIAGIKLHAAIDVTIRKNHIHHNTMGIWCDWQAQGTRITQNLLHDNQVPEYAERAMGSETCQDLFIEVSHGPTLIDNNILMSKASLKLAAQGVAMIHNLIMGSFTSVGAGTDYVVKGKNQPRYTPYHFPHRTDVMGFMTILHGDNRFCNNIFIQNYDSGEDAAEKAREKEGYDNILAGTSIFDEYPTFDEWYRDYHVGEPLENIFAWLELHFDHLPIWSEGNVYLNGARPYKKEHAPFVDDEKKARFTLKETDGAVTFDTNIFEILKEYRVNRVTSDTLGKAFEPEQRYENPDGSAITFDVDYWGNSRGKSVVPGPFALPDEQLTAMQKRGEKDV